MSQAHLKPLFWPLPFFWLVSCHVGAWKSISAYHRCRFISVKPPTRSEPLSAHQQWPRHRSVPPSPLAIIIFVSWPTLLALFQLSVLHRLSAINHNFLWLPLAQSQGPANQKTWLMELSLLLTTWAPLNCCLRGTLPRTYAWCRPRRLSAGSRYSTSLTLSLSLSNTHTHHSCYFYFS